MIARHFRLLGLLLAAVAFLGMLLVAAAALLAGGSAGGTLATGRSVVTHSDSFYLLVENSSDTATIRTAGRTIVVQPHRLLVDGRPVGTLDPRARSVELSVRHGEVTAIADGRPVLLTLR